MSEFWVFGYGSLLWRPGFDHRATVRARLYGYHRSLCVHSHVYRGTPQQPGLVLGLDRGGSCLGLAFAVDEAQRQPVLAYLRERELVTNIYKERVLPVELADGRIVPAVTFVVDREHRQYAGRLDPAMAARIVRGATGKAGPNADYVRNTVAHLRSLRIRDRWLEDVGTHMDGAATAPLPVPAP